MSSRFLRRVPTELRWHSLDYVVAGEPGLYIILPRNMFILWRVSTAIFRRGLPKFGCLKSIGRFSAGSLHVQNCVNFRKKHPGKVSAKLASLTYVCRLLCASANRHQASKLTHLKSPNLKPPFRVSHVSSACRTLGFKALHTEVGMWCTVFPPMCAANRHERFFFKKKKNRRMNVATLDLRHVQTCPTPFPNYDTRERFSATAHQHPTDTADEHTHIARHPPGIPRGHPWEILQMYLLKV